MAFKHVFNFLCSIVHFETLHCWASGCQAGALGIGFLGFLKKSAWHGVDTTRQGYCLHVLCLNHVLQLGATIGLFSKGV